MSDRVLVRLAPELHRAIRTKADAAGASMNSWIIQVLAYYHNVYRPQFEEGDCGSML